MLALGTAQPRTAMLAGEQDRLEKERQFRDLEVSYKQLSFLLERLNSYNTQATLVTGFAFTAFSADALQALPYEDSPIRAYLFCFFCSLAMAAAIAAVVLSSYLMARSERLAMNSSVEMAVAATRLRTPRVKWLYTISLVGLVGAACFLVFATCGGEEAHCNGVGWMVVGVFVSFIAICTACICRVAQDFDQAAEVSARVGSECRDVLLESDAAAGSSGSSRDASIRASSGRTIRAGSRRAPDSTRACKLAEAEPVVMCTEFRLRGAEGASLSLFMPSWRRAGDSSSLGVKMDFRRLTSSLAAAQQAAHTSASLEADAITKGGLISGERLMWDANERRGMLELRHKEILSRIDILNQMSTQAMLVAGAAVTGLGGESLQVVNEEVGCRCRWLLLAPLVLDPHSP